MILQQEMVSAQHLLWFVFSILPVSILPVMTCNELKGNLSLKQPACDATRTLMQLKFNGFYTHPTP
jgi:hypothetical protein